MLSDLTFVERGAPGVVLSMAVMSGCGGCTGLDAERPSSSGAREPEVGVVEGVVRLADGELLPEYPVSSDPNQPAPPKECSPPKLLDRQPVRLAAGRGLENVVVGVTDFRRAPPSTPKVHEVKIRDCRLDPPVLSATKGDTIRLRNETDYPFLPSLGPSRLLQTLLVNETRDIALERGGVVELGCGFAASCGRTDVLVFYHPVHQKTGKDGRFRIDNVPVDQDVVLHAWHPLFEEATQRVRVPKGGKVSVEFVLRAAPPAPAATDGKVVPPSSTGAGKATATPRPAPPTVQ